jgi:hypothetical protein
MPVSCCSSNFHRNPAASPFDTRLTALVQLRRLLSRYDSILKEENASLPDLRAAFSAAEGELEEWGRVWKEEIQSSLSESLSP